MNGSVERAYPWVLAAAGGLGWSFLDLGTPENVNELLSAIISVGAITVGFLATALSILISIEDKPFVRRLIDMGGYSSLLGYLKTAIFSSFLLSVVSALGVICKFGSPQVKNFAFSAWTGIALLAALSSLRVVILFTKLLHYSVEESENHG